MTKKFLLDEDRMHDGADLDRSLAEIPRIAAE